MKKLPPHVTKTEDNKFRVRYRKSNTYSIPFDKVFDTENEAIKANDDYIEKNKKKKYNLLKHIGFCDFCDLYLEWFRKKTKKPKPQTLRSYIKYINILKIAIGNVDVTTIDTLFLIDILDKESKRSSRANGAKPSDIISQNTFKHEYTMLSILFKKMKVWEFIEKNPMLDIEAPTFDTKEIIVPEFEELDDIKKKIMSTNIRDRCQFLMALYGGMRAEEIAGQHLERDIDIELMELYVNTVIVQDEDGSYIEDTPKSKKSVRGIPFPSEFFEVYNEYLKYRENFVSYLKYKNPDYVEIPNLFLNKDGHYFRPNRISRNWTKFAKQPEVNIPLTLHGLRHYYITNQANYNTELTESEVQDLAGHSNINTTRGYIHTSKKRINKNATNIFYKFDRDTLYKNGKNTLVIPIEHIVSIIIGKPELSNVNELKITLAQMSNTEIDFYNLSSIIDNCKNYLITNYPALIRIESYKYSKLNNKEIITFIKKQFGKEFEIKKPKIEE